LKKRTSRLPQKRFDCRDRASDRHAIVRMFAERRKCRKGQWDGGRNRGIGNVVVHNFFIVDFDLFRNLEMI